MSICFTISNELLSSGSKQQWRLSPDNNNVHGNWSNHISKSGGKRPLGKKCNTTTNLWNRTGLLISSRQKLMFTGAELWPPEDPDTQRGIIDQITMKCQELRPLILAPLRSVMFFQERQALLVKDLLQLHQSHGQLFCQTTTDLTVENSSTHPGASHLSAHLSPHKLKFLSLEISHAKTHCWPDFQQCATTEESPLETATNAAESNLGATTEQMSLAEIAKCVPSAVSPGRWLKKSGLS